MASLRKVFGSLGQFGEDVVEGLDKTLLDTADIDGSQKVSEVKNQFYLTPEEVSVIRDYDYDPSDPDHTTANGGSVQFGNGEYEISTAEQENSRATLSTAQIGEYRAGTVASAGFYIRHEQDLLPSEYIQGGYFFPGGDNGLILRKNGEGLSFVVRAEGDETEFKRFEGEWDTDGVETVTDDSGADTGRYIGIDALDGNGNSGIDIEEIEPASQLASGTIWRIEFTWYGGGAIVLNRISLLDDGRQRKVPVLAYKVENQISFPQPNQPVTIDIQSEREQTVYAAGRQFSTRGDFRITKSRAEHIPDSAVTVPDTNYVVLAAFRRKASEKNTVLGLGDLSVNTDQPLSIHTRIAPELSSAGSEIQPSDTRSQDSAVVFQDLDANGGIVGNADVDTTTDDEGNTVLSGFKFGGTIEGTQAGPLGLGTQSTTGEESGFEFPVPRREWVVVMAQSVGTGPATVNISTNVIQAK